MTRGAYLGGGSLVHKGSYSHPAGTKISSTPAGARKLHKTARMTANMVARELPAVARQISIIVELLKAKRVRLDATDARVLHKVHSILVSFAGNVDRNERYALEEGWRLIEKLRRPIARQLKAKETGPNPGAWR